MVPAHTHTLSLSPLFLFASLCIDSYTYLCTHIQLCVTLDTFREQMDVDAALELLNKQFQNSAVRQYAVKCLDTATDETLIMYLLQLVQALKYEPLITEEEKPVPYPAAQEENTTNNKPQGIDETI